MPAYVDTFNTIVALGVIVLQAVTVFLLVALLFFRTRTNPGLLFFKKHGILFVFLIALGSMLTSLFYSNVIGFAACELCWKERLFIYPQIILAGYLLWRPVSHRTGPIFNMSFTFALFGTLVSMFHVYIENGGSSSLACATGGPNVISCAIRYVYEFGYITIPVMALSAGLIMVVLLANYKYMTKK
jgi:disulfide bond formation protein DsbB